MEFQLTQALRRALQQRPDAIAHVYGERRTTWRVFADRVARLAAVFRELGVQTGDRIAMLALNSDRYFEYMMASWWVGASLNPVNTRWSAAEVAYSLDDCDTKLLLLDERYTAMANELRERSKSLTTIMYAGEGDAPPGFLDYERLVAAATPIPDAEIGGESLAGVFYTGGTTGFPKGVMLSHNALLSNAFTGLLDLPYADDEIVLGAPALFHQAGMCIIIRAFVRNCRSVILPAFAPVDVMQAIAKERVTFTLLVPTMIQMLVDHPDFDTYDLSSLRRVLYGASPISAGLLDRACQKLPNVALTQGYGMTETGGPYTVLGPYYHRPEGRDPDRLRSCGRPVWGMDVRIVDSAGNDVPLGQVGEIISRGPGLMQGYWNRPVETAAAMRGGWMHSGDGGYMDDEGFIFIVDRVKDMIVSGGENVYSSEVENAVSKHPDVESCAVIGIPSERWGEAVHAIVVRRRGTAVTAEEIRAHAKTLIAGYKCPVSVEFRDAIPVSGPGKPLKAQLREPFWRGLDRRIG